MENKRLTALESLCARFRFAQYCVYCGNVARMLHVYNIEGLSYDYFDSMFGGNCCCSPHCRILSDLREFTSEVNIVYIRLHRFTF